MNTDNNGWLVVDLDYTLIKTDLFLEQLLRALLTRPFLLLKVLFQSGFRIPMLKHLLAEKLEVSYSHLPYNEIVLDKISRAKSEGQRIMLATAASELHAQKINEHLDVFDEVVASDPDVNLKGKTKVNKIEDTIGGDRFCFIGDSNSEIPVFKKAKKSFLVNPSRKLLKTCKSASIDYEILDSSRTSFWSYDSKFLRPYQWVKNIVFFIPGVTGLGLYDLKNLWLVGPTFTVMCLLASFVYIMNDIADVESDRRHSDKKNRCFASGKASIEFGFFTAMALLLLAVLILFFWQPPTLYYFLAYFFLTVAYTMHLKEIAILDIFILVSFYLLRILIGVETLGVPYSTWFFSFCFLLFSNLAFLKRYIEVNKDSNGKNIRRKYDARDREFLRVCGIGSIFASIVILLIYTKSSEFSDFYRDKDLFSLICFPYALLMLRMWYLGSRNLMDSDPLVYTIRSPLSYIAVIASCVILFYAR